MLSFNVIIIFILVLTCSDKIAEYQRFRLNADNR